MLKLGYKASAEQFSPQDLLAYSVKAEECGFDSVFVSDHFQPWRHTGGHGAVLIHVPWVRSARATSRVVMGTSVLTPTFRYHPSIVAQAFAPWARYFRTASYSVSAPASSLNEVPGDRHGLAGNEGTFARMRESVRLIRQL